MPYWIRWRAANGEEGPRIGPFEHRPEAERYVNDMLRRSAAQMEHVFGNPGVWTPEGELYRDDMFHDETPLGAYIIEDEPEG